jgi:hypothetical protein
MSCIGMALQAGGCNFMESAERGNLELRVYSDFRPPMLLIRFRYSQHRQECPRYRGASRYEFDTLASRTFDLYGRAFYSVSTW